MPGICSGLPATCRTWFLSWRANPSAFLASYRPQPTQIRYCALQKCGEPREGPGEQILITLRGHGRCCCSKSMPRSLAQASLADPAMHVWPATLVLPPAVAASSLPLAALPPLTFYFPRSKNILPSQSARPPHLRRHLVADAGNVCDRVPHPLPRPLFLIHLTVRAPSPLLARLIGHPLLSYHAPACPALSRAPGLPASAQPTPAPPAMLRSYNTAMKIIFITTTLAIIWRARLDSRERSPAPGAAAGSFLLPGTGTCASIGW